MSAVSLHIIGLAVDLLWWLLLYYRINLTDFAELHLPIFSISPYYYFPFGRMVAGQLFPFSKASLHGAVGCRV